MFKQENALLIKNALILDVTSPFYGQRMDVLFADGYLTDVAPQIDKKGVERVEGSSLCISPGWMDVGAQANDPGFEWREDLDSLCRAAAAGGYTAVAVAPNTRPCLHAKAELMYVRDKTREKQVEVFPLAAVSRDCAGKEITEFMDMHQAGALAFADGERAIGHSGLMRLALLYVKAFDGLVMNRPYDAQLAPNGQVHESALSVELGLPGIPSLAEELMIQRDLYLLEYTGSRLHLSNLSTAGGVELVRLAKDRGLRVTASVTAMHLCFSEEAIRDFDPHYKLSPPLRSEEDRQALLAGVLDGTIDFIASGHTPLEQEAKKKAFSEAEFGVSALETTFAMLNTFSGLSAKVLVEQLAVGPRRVLGLPVPRLAKAEPANFTVFDLEKSWVPGKTQTWHSKSRNTPFWGKELKGQVLLSFRKKTTNGR